MYGGELERFKHRQDKVNVTLTLLCCTVEDTMEQGYDWRPRDQEGLSHESKTRIWINKGHTLVSCGHKLPQTGWLFILSRSHTPGSQKSKIKSLEVLERNPSLSSPAPGGCQRFLASLACGHTTPTSPLSLPSSCLLLSVSVSSSLLSQFSLLLSLIISS